MAHRIQRLVVELHGGSAEAAAALQSAVQAVLQRDWLPLIDAACTACDDGDRVWRIDRLALQLPGAAARWPDGFAGAAGGDRPPGIGGTGAATAEQLVDALSVQLADRLRPSLSAALADAVPVDAPLELLDHALHEGRLPWWAPAQDPAPLRQATEALLARPAAAWRALLGQPEADADALRRLEALLDTAQQARLLASLAEPGPAGAWPPALDGLWRAALALAAATLGLPQDRLCSAWWREAVAAALRLPASPWAARMPAVLDRLAAATARPPAALRAALRQALDRIGGRLPSAPAGAARAAGDAAAPWEALWAALDEGVPAAVAASDDHDAAGAAGALAGLRQLAGGGGPAGAWARRLLDGWAALAPALRADLCTALAAAQREAGAAPVSARAGVGPADGRATPPAAGAGRPADHPGAPAAQPGADDPVLRWLAVALRQALATGPQSPSADEAAAWARAWRDTSRETGRDTGRNTGRDASHLPGLGRAVAARSPRPAAEALTVGNAGLVLLWPFLPRFAEHRGLRAAGRWCDDQAPQRLARLLQCLASGERTPPEVLLPLNKLLCGLPLETVMDAAPALDDAEAEACEDLLRAAVAQAGVLGELSVDGLRGSFLLRAGQLGARDGQALLQVERQPWDLLLDRLPWALGWVRLPWMPALLQVHW